MNKAWVSKVSAASAMAVFLFPAPASGQKQLRPELVLRSGEGYFSTYAASPDGKWFVAYGDHRIEIFSALDARQFRTISVGEGVAGPQSIAVLGNGAEILVPGRTLSDGFARVLRFRVDDAERLPDLVLPERGLTVRVACDTRDDLVALQVAGVIVPGGPVQGNLVKIVHTSGGTEVFRAPTAPPMQAEIALSSDGLELALANASEVRLFDRRPGAAATDSALVQNLRPDAARTLRFSPSGAFLAVQQAPNPYGRDLAPNLQLFRTATGQTMPVVGDSIFAADFIDDGKVVVSRARDFASVDVATGNVAPLWPGRKELVQKLIVTPDRSHAVLGSLFGTEIAEVSTGKVGDADTMPVHRPLKFAFRPDDSGLATSGEWDLQTGEYNGGQEDAVTALAISPDSRYVARVGLDLLRVSVRGGTTRELRAGNGELWHGVTFSPDSKMLAVGWSPAAMGPHKDQIRLLSLPDLRQIGMVSFAVESLKYIDNFVFSPDGHWAAASVAETITIFRVDGAHLSAFRTIALPRELHEVPQADGTYREKESDSPYGRSVGQLLFSPDSHHLAVGAEFLHVFSTRSWSEEGTPAKQSAISLMWTADSTQILALVGQDEKTMTVDDMDRPQQFSSIDVATRKVTASDATAGIGFPAVLDGRGRLLAAQVPDGVALYSATDFSLKGTLYEFAHNEWLFATPDGLFDGTPGGWKYMNWRFNNKTFELQPVELYFREFYRPGLLADVMAGRQVKAPKEIASLDRRQPTVTLQAEPAGDKARIRVEVKESRKQAASETMAKGAGVRDIRLFRNGVLVKIWRGELTLDGDGSAAVVAEIPIVAGENRFTAYGFNDADVKSSDAEAVVEGGPALERKGVAFVLAIGINRYAAETATRHLNLSFSEADAKDFAATFSAAQKETGEFAEVRVITLLSEQATRSNIETALRLLAGGSRDGLSQEQVSLFKGVEAVRPEDGLFVFYAGHGSATTEHFFLLPTDIQPEHKSSDPASMALSEDALGGMLENIAPGRAFLVIDACHSGKALDGDGMEVGPMNARGLAQLAYEKGMDILTASEASEVAIESANLAGGHGYLTYALVEEGLKRRAAASEGRIELRGWFRFASQRVPELQAGPRAGQPDVDEAAQHPRAFYRREPEKRPFIVASGTP